MLMGGVLVDRSRAAELRTARDEAAARLRSAIEQGCVVKDLDMGLVDFPTTFHGPGGLPLLETRRALDRHKPQAADKVAAIEECLSKTLKGFGVLRLHVGWRDKPPKTGQTHRRQRQCCKGLAV
jgi:hypothetical protein